MVADQVGSTALADHNLHLANLSLHLANHNSHLVDHNLHLADLVALCSRPHTQGHSLKCPTHVWHGAQWCIKKAWHRPQEVHNYYLT